MIQYAQIKATFPSLGLQNSRTPKGQPQTTRPSATASAFSSVLGGLKKGTSIVVSAAMTTSSSVLAKVTFVFSLLPVAKSANSSTYFLSPDDEEWRFIHTDDSYAHNIEDVIFRGGCGAKNATRTVFEGIFTEVRSFCKICYGDVIGPIECIPSCFLAVKNTSDYSQEFGDCLDNALDSNFQSNRNDILDFDFKVVMITFWALCFFAIGYFVFYKTEKGIQFRKYVTSCGNRSEKEARLLGRSAVDQA